MRHDPSDDKLQKTATELIWCHILHYLMLFNILLLMHNMRQYSMYHTSSLQSDYTLRIILHMEKVTAEIDEQNEERHQMVNY